MGGDDSSSDGRKPRSGGTSRGGAGVRGDGFQQLKARGISAAPGPTNANDGVVTTDLTPARRLFRRSSLAPQAARGFLFCTDRRLPPTKWLISSASQGGP